MTTTLELYGQRFPRRDDESPEAHRERLLDEMQADRSERLDVRTSDQKNQQGVIR